MSKLGKGRSVTELKNQINSLKKELTELNKPKEMPELIESANLVRINEYLKKSDSLKTQLLDVYGEYAESLEDLLSTVFDIQNELKDIIKEEAKSLSSKGKSMKKTTKPAPSSKRKSTRKKAKTSTRRSSKKSSKKTKRKR